MASSAMKIGPWGASKGTPRDIDRKSIPMHLRSITVRSSEEYGGRIYGFSFVYDDQKGQSIVNTWGSKTKGEEQETIDLSEDYYVNKISGSFDKNGVTSLQILTTAGSEENFGYPSGTTFSVPLQEGKGVLSFFGRSGNSITALGVYVPGDVTSGVKVGPWGSYRGMPLDIMENYKPLRLRSITIRSSESTCGRIYGISFQYYTLSLQGVTMGPWGSQTKGYTKMIMLGPGPGEYVNDLCGTFDDRGVTSLKIITNTGAQYGPYGCPSGTDFSLPMQGNATALGFFGRSDGDILVALGTYVGRRAPPESIRPLYNYN